MATILDYIDKYGFTTFEDKEFNEVDSLIISLLPYVNFTGILPENKKEKMSIHDAGNIFINKTPYSEMKYQIQGVRAAYDVLYKIKDCPRFQDLKLYNYTYKYAEDMQFGAMFCDIDDKHTYVLFEGTDDYVSGWYEDFQMCYEFPIRAQREAIKYINKHIKLTDNKSYVFAGHSKGGNLSMVAYMYLNPLKKFKVKKVKNYDGPGFIDSIRDSRKFKSMTKKLDLVVPNYSVVGLLFNTIEPNIVIESKKKGILAHNAITWTVDDDKFVPSTLSSYSRRIDKSMTNWINSMTIDERIAFTNDFFAVFNRCGIKSLIDIRRSNFKQIIGIVQEAGNLDKVTKARFVDLVKIIFEYLKEDIFSKK